MSKCPVCDSEMNTLLCSCGYDASRDYGKYPTFGPVRGVKAFAPRPSKQAPKDALVCTQCGGTAFSIRIPDNTRRCAACGWTPDRKPHIECTCGGRYFLVRAEDGALICPLCGKITAPKDFLPRTKAPDQKTPVSVPASVPAPVKTRITAIAAGSDHTVALYSDGTVCAIGANGDGQCDVQSWKDIVAITAGDRHTVGLKKDGTVVAAGASTAKRISANHCCDVSSWKNITAIAAGSSYTLGLKTDATVVVAGSSHFAQHAAKSAKGIRFIAAGPRHCAFISQDGTVLSDNFPPITLAAWKGVTAVCLGADHIAGLFSNGSTTATGSNPYGQCFVNWTGIQMIAAGHSHTLGLRRNGTVAATGDNRSGQCNVAGWSNITAIAAGKQHSVGLKSDGTLVAAGPRSSPCCEVHRLLPK